MNYEAMSDIQFTEWLWNALAVHDEKAAVEIALECRAYLLSRIGELYGEIDNLKERLSEFEADQRTLLHQIGDIVSTMPNSSPAYKIKIAAQLLAMVSAALDELPVDTPTA